MFPRPVTFSLSLFGTLALLACGGNTGSTARSPNVRMLLTNDVESLRFASPAERQSIYQGLVRESQSDPARASSNLTVLFPIVGESGGVVAGILPAGTDLLSADADAMSLELIGDWSSDPQPASGLSEADAAKAVAANLLKLWDIHPDGTVRLERVPSAPYAAAVIQASIFRLNPLFLNVACGSATENASRTAENQ